MDRKARAWMAVWTQIMHTRAPARSLRIGAPGTVHALWAPSVAAGKWRRLRKLTAAGEGAKSGNQAK